MMDRETASNFIEYLDDMQVNYIFSNIKQYQIIDNLILRLMKYAG